jgi:hypothetical protein
MNSFGAAYRARMIVRTRGVDHIIVSTNRNRIGDGVVAERGGHPPHVDCSVYYSVRMKYYRRLLI